MTGPTDARGTPDNAGSGAAWWASLHGWEADLWSFDPLVRHDAHLAAPERFLEPRPLPDRAAVLANRYAGGLLIGETLAAGLVDGRQLFFGTPRDIGPRLRAGGDDPGIAIHLTTWPFPSPSRP